MAQYKVDTSWKAYRKRLKQAFVESGSYGLLYASPFIAVGFGLFVGADAAVEFMSDVFAILIVVSVAGANVIRSHDQRLVDALNKVSEEGGAS